MNNVDHPTIETLSDYVHGELSERDDAAVHAHLAGCSACAELHDIEARLGEVLRAHARAEERELPLGFEARIVDAAIASDASSATGWREAFAWLWRPAIAVPVAAALALAIYFGAGAVNPPLRSATIDATSYVESHTALAADMPFADSSALPVTFASEVSAR
ncbi:MAG: zf-HC2 domain-containing protein [Candidatus Eremiobacteraeota bacterium]|nr:zf-HC2 domain-containing protein [Candidatus Eremiobacteraeota bacterium]MBV8331859.1 zf-HC2 domain-containing protein [Candidatus Eremiobacteraeota bacterium]MBV8432669.1 zf-HC2 domain-containing protein [Candidatus Eremiobacteraeota bacterium]MBV8583720.1 zf-HC2 domain-containing protein [Candidatus Eremiobacteraeota bacterium]MBV8720795.1 zf-HC2 domain-containing protein [Candidatus Eremiobacteraeota bacterium]